MGLRWLDRVKLHRLDAGGEDIREPDAITLSSTDAFKSINVVPARVTVTRDGSSLMNFEERVTKLVLNPGRLVKVCGCLIQKIASLD